MRAARLRAARLSSDVAPSRQNVRASSGRCAARRSMNASASAAAPRRGVRRPRLRGDRVEHRRQQRRRGAGPRRLLECERVEREALRRLRRVRESFERRHRETPVRRKPTVRDAFADDGRAERCAPLQQRLGAAPDRVNRVRALVELERQATDGGPPFPLSFYRACVERPPRGRGGARLGVIAVNSPQQSRHAVDKRHRRRVRSGLITQYLGFQARDGGAARRRPRVGRRGGVARHLERELDAVQTVRHGLRLVEVARGSHRLPRREPAARHELVDVSPSRCETS